MTSKERWESILANIQPAYFKWRDMLDAGPTIKPVLEKKQRLWNITLTEVWPDEVTGNSGSALLDKRVDWTVEELSKWQGVKRMAWDQWYFDDKRQAEKFITLYYMVWAE